MDIAFKIGRVCSEMKDCTADVVSAGETVVATLRGLRYRGTTRQRNSCQLDIAFDEALLEALANTEWDCQWRPALDMARLDEQWGRQEADAIMARGTGQSVVVEIEKANKKTIWFDFIKIWMFVGSGQASAGLLICPLNYAHRHGVWNLYDEACRYKAFLKRFAEVPDGRINRVGVIGYEQRLVQSSGSVLWDAAAFNRVKLGAGRET